MSTDEVDTLLFVPGDTANTWQSAARRLAAEVLKLRAERDEWRDVSVGPAYATLLREQAQTAEAELARIRALLADDSAVATVAEAAFTNGLRSVRDASAYTSGADDDYLRGAADDIARAVLAALAGLIGADDA